MTILFIYNISFGKAHLFIYVLSMTISPYICSCHLLHIIVVLHKTDKFTQCGRSIILILILVIYRIIPKKVCVFFKFSDHYKTD